MARIFTLAIYVSMYYAAAQTADAGKRPYQAGCVGCHAEDGTGGGHGPNIVDVRRSRATSLEAVRSLILKGIPGWGMPAFHISEEEAGAIAAYVMALKQPASAAAPEGNAAAGERFFARKGNCSACHMVRGRGGILGPDLSNIGRDRTLLQIEHALRDPGSAPAPSYRTVTVRLRNGETIRGIAKNESAFDLQLLPLDGKLHLLFNAQLAELVREKSLMPKGDPPPHEPRDLTGFFSRQSCDPKANLIP